MFSHPAGWSGPPLSTETITPTITHHVRGLCRGHDEPRKLLICTDRAGFEPAIRF
jgi:hypothetical protein